LSGQSNSPKFNPPNYTKLRLQATNIFIAGCEILTAVNIQVEAF